MGLKNISRELRNLTYTEMMTVAAHLHEQIASMRAEHGLASVPPPAASLAEMLANLEFHPGEKTEMQDQEQKLLARAFSRKRTISVRYDNPGWHLDITTLPGARVVDLTLRDGLLKMHDQIVTMEALTNGGHRK